MKLTALQLPARFGDFDGQLKLAETLLEGGPRTDLVLFSEAILTGYVSTDRDFDLTPFAEERDGKTREALTHLAKRFDCLVVGPLIEKTTIGCFNSLLGVTPAGELALHYRKHHPWFPETWATPGPTAASVFEWRGVKFATGICFDVHFLALDASPQLRQADVLLFSSAWVDDVEAPDSRPGHLQPLATDFDVGVLNANWGVGRPRLPGQGGSMAVSRHGELVSRVGTGLTRLDVDLSSLR